MCQKLTDEQIEVVLNRLRGGPSVGEQAAMLAGSVVEHSVATIRGAADAIDQLRQENERLRQELAEVKAEARDAWETADLRDDFEFTTTGPNPQNP